MGLLSNLNKMDNKISRWIHQLDHLLPTFVLYPFTAFFHPGLIWISYLSVFYLSRFDKGFTLLYALATLVCLIATTILKKLSKRARPELNLKVSKPHHFRKKQKNNSMPSGDAFQSAVYVVFLYSLNVNPVLLLCFHTFVCMGRVYYMCHWVADTLVSTVIGIMIAKLLLQSELHGLLQTIQSALL